MNLGIAIVTDTDPAVVSLTGELDIASAAQLEDRIRAVVDAGHPRLVLDLAELAFCDSTGIGVFVRANNECQQRDGYLRLAAPSPTVARILEVVGLLDVFPTYRTVDAALRCDDGGRGVVSR
jgi:anti-sigma B factor antagonist